MYNLCVFVEEKKKTKLTYSAIHPLGPVPNQNMTCMLFYFRITRYQTNTVHVLLLLSSSI